MAELSASGGTTAAGGGGAPEGEVKLTPKQLRLLEREKAAKAKLEAEAAKAATSSTYGELRMVQSTEITGRTWVRCVGVYMYTVFNARRVVTPPPPLPFAPPRPSPPRACSVSSLTPALAGSTVLIRARLFVMRETGKVLFITLRQGVSTAQAVVLKSDDKDLFKWATSAYSARC